MQLRDHKAIVIEEFNGFWSRGNDDAVPLDHFKDCQNVVYDQRLFKTRPGIGPYVAIANVIRMYTYVMQTGQSLLLLDSNGDIYHVINPNTPGEVIHGPILSIPEMTDFKFISIAGRAYITPFNTYTDDLGANHPRALEDDFVYVYLGDGTNARKAAGNPPVGTLSLATGGAGNCEAGVHVLGVAYETDTGFITQIAGFADITLASSGVEIDVSNIPVSPDSFVVARRLVATQAIDPTLYTGNLEGYQFFFIPDGRIDNNVDTTASVSFFDIELFSDASHLLDILPEIPAAVGLTTYHGQMVVYSTFDDISLMYISYPGEPEAIDAVSGLVIIPLDGLPITNAQEFRDVLYAFKQTRTFSVTDNGDVPSSWPVIVMDQGIGASVHGVAAVLDSGGVNIDFLLIVDWSGLMQFNGAYTRPELSWKIEKHWFNLERNAFSNIQIMNDSLSQMIYIIQPNKRLLIADYRNALNAKDIKWGKWRMRVQVSTIALIETNKLLIGSNDVEEDD